MEQLFLFFCIDFADVFMCSYRVTVTQLRGYVDSFFRISGRAALLPNPPVSHLEQISHRERTHGDSVGRDRYSYLGQADQGQWIMLGYAAFRYDEQHDDASINPFELKSEKLSPADSIYHVSVCLHMFSPFIVTLDNILSVILYTTLILCIRISVHRPRHDNAPENKRAHVQISVSR